MKMTKKLPGTIVSHKIKKKGHNRLKVSYTFEALRDTIFPDANPDVNIISGNVDYSRNIVDFWVDGVPNAPYTPEGQEAPAATYVNGTFSSGFPTVLFSGDLALEANND